MKMDESIQKTIEKWNFLFTMQSKRFLHWNSTIFNIQPWGLIIRIGFSDTYVAKVEARSSQWLYYAFASHDRATICDPVSHRKHQGKSQNVCFSSGPLKSVG